MSKKHADWGPETGDIINSTHSILYPIFFMSLVVIFFSPNKAVSSGFLPVLTTQLLLYEKHKTELGPGLWSSVLLSLTKPASHRCDERCPFPAAVLRQQEGHVAVGCQVFDCLVHDPRKAVKGNKGSG